jgi:hypothetical protein
MNRGPCRVARRRGQRRPWRVVLRATVAVALVAPTGATATTGGFATDHVYGSAAVSGAQIALVESYRTPNSLTEAHRYVIRVFGRAPGVPATVGVSEAQSVPSLAASAHGWVVGWQGPSGVFSASLALNGGELSDVVHHDTTVRLGDDSAGGGGSAGPLVEGPAIAADDTGDRLVAWENSTGLYVQYVGAKGAESVQRVAPAPSAYATNNFSVSLGRGHSGWITWEDQGELHATAISGQSVGPSVALGPTPNGGGTGPGGLIEVPGWQQRTDAAGDLWVLGSYLSYGEEQLWHVTRGGRRSTMTIGGVTESWGKLALSVGTSGPVVAYVDKRGAWLSMFKLDGSRARRVRLAGRGSTSVGGVASDATGTWALVNVRRACVLSHVDARDHPRSLTIARQVRGRELRCDQLVDGASGLLLALTRDILSTESGGGGGGFSSMLGVSWIRSWRIVSRRTLHESGSYD